MSTMNYSSCFLFIYLLIFGHYTLKTHSHNNFGSTPDDNDARILEETSFEDLNGDRNRIGRSLVIAPVATDISTGRNVLFLLKTFFLFHP